MTKVIGIRATSGGGKTTLAREFITKYSGTPLKDSAGRIFAYRVLPESSGFQRNLYILGPYEAVTGGCDRLKSQEIICNLIKELAPLGDVLYEGLLVSGITGRYAFLSKELAHRAHFIFGFLDTPLDKCIERTLQRRSAAGNTKPFNPNKTLIPKFFSVLRCRQRLETAGCDTRTIPHNFGFGSVDQWIREDQRTVTEPTSGRSLMAASFLLNGGLS